MERLLGCKYPPGLRFHPTDEELFMFYLKRKVLGKSLGPPMLAEVDVYRFAPWDLPAMSCLKTRDLSWYFLCPRAKKYSNGGRTNRATEWGYWKSTGNDRTVKYASRPVGKIKTLIFHRGKAPKGERTDWVMHEYKLEDQLLNDKGVSQDSYVICKIYEKRGLGPRNGEDYGAHFVEEEWDDEFDELVDGQERDSGVVLHDTRCGCAGDSPDGSASVLTAASLVDTPIVAAATNVGSPCATSASVGSPYNIAGYVGTAFVTATPVGMPDVTPAPVDMPIVTPASVGSASTLSAPSASVGFASPLSAPSASVGFASPLSAPSASVGFASPLSAPSASVGFASLLSAPSASVGFASPLSAPSASVGFASPLSAPSASVDCASPLSAPSASVGSASSLSAPSASVGCASTLSAPSASVASAVDATAMIEDDMDWLLNQFIEEDVGDFFNDLGDLADHSNQNIDWDDCFIEMKDLLD